MPPGGDTTVVYVAGYGRSGSTLLDLLLGQLDGWFSMGEFRHFWHAVRDRYRCGCGEEVPDCPIWSEVLATASSTTPGIANALPDRRDVLRIRRVPALVEPRLLGRHRITRDRVADIAVAMYRATAAVTGARVLVDSSKDPIFPLVLRGAPGVRLHVVHLVRDSRAVAYSWQRTRVRPETEGRAHMPVHSALHSSVEWDLRNALVHLSHRGGLGYTRLTYEALVNDPAAALDVVTRAVVGTGAVELGSQRPPTATTNHTVGGNPMRFAAGGLQVRPDVEWQQALPRRDRALVTALTWPLLRAYGYV